MHSILSLESSPYRPSEIRILCSSFSIPFASCRASHSVFAYPSFPPCFDVSHIWLNHMNVPDRQSLWRLVGADAVASVSFHATGVGSTTHDGELCGFVWLCTAHCQDIGHSVFCRLVQSSDPNQFVLWKCNTMSSCSKQGHTGTAIFHAGHSASCPHPVTV